MEEYSLDENISKITGQEKVPFGVAIIQTNDLSIGSEICVESLTPFKISNLYLLDGVDIITNGCGWVFRPNNLKSVMETIIGNIRMNCGIYVFSNFNGCGGANHIYEGSSFINYCGNFVASTSYLGFNEVEVVNAKINLDELRTRRANFPARNVQQNEKMYDIQRIPVKFKMIDGIGNESIPIEIPLYQIDIPNQNILGIARFLWDNLKRSKCKGYFIELTDDIYSILLCICLKTMCKELIKLLKGNEKEREIILNHLYRMNGNNNIKYDNDPFNRVLQYNWKEIYNILEKYMNESDKKKLDLNFIAFR
jgi:NAD+ synthase (glutamine-hydrolysing)